MTDAADQIPGAPHPRETKRLIGQDAAASAFTAALTSGRMPHAWLLAGPKGVGKASFAYLASGALLEGQQTLHASPKIIDGIETRLRPVIRTPNEKTGKMRGQIAVEDMRAMKTSLTLAAPDGGWRTVIVDAAEEMNASTANALLKVLEEPPAKVAFFLVSHTPRRLLPTILSRCRRLDFEPLDDGALSTAFEAAMGEPPTDALVAASRGSVGAAIALAAQDGTALQDAIAKVLAPLPSHIDRAALHALADTAGASGKDEAFRTTTNLIADLTARMATCASGADGPPPGYERLHPIATHASASDWAETANTVTALAERVLALNLDRRQALLDMVAQIERVAKRAA